MTLDEIKNQLLAKYTIEHIINLDQFDPDKKGKLYNCLRKIRKSSFADQERIVFIAKDPLTKTYADQPHDIITLLQQNIQCHDIPHYFVIVLTNIPTVKEELEYVRVKYNPQEKLAIACHQWNN